MKTFADHSIVRVVFLYIRMCERESVVEDVSLAEEEIFLPRLELVFNPFESFEPYEFYRACLVGESCADARHARFAVSLHIRHRPDKLIVDSVVVYFVYFMDFTSIYIAEREILQKILKGKDTEFFIKKLSAFRTYSLQKFYFCLKNIDHAQSK